MRQELPAGIARHAGGGAKNSQIEQCFEGAQRIAVEFAFVVDAAHPGPLDEIVREDLVPELDDLTRFREKAVAANVEPETFMFNGAADTADIAGVLLDHADRIALLRQKIGCGEPGRTSPNDGHIDLLAAAALIGHSFPRFFSRLKVAARS